MARMKNKNPKEELKSRYRAELGERIAAAIDQSDLNQSGVARELTERGIETSPQSVQKWYHGTSPPEPWVIGPLADVLSVQHAWLATGIGPIRKTATDARRLAAAEPSPVYMLGVGALTDKMSPSQINLWLAIGQTIVSASE